MSIWIERLKTNLEKQAFENRRPFANNLGGKMPAEPIDLNVELQLSQLRRAQAESDKFAAETRKLLAEAMKLDSDASKSAAEVRKLVAEARKHDSDVDKSVAEVRKLLAETSKLASESMKLRTEEGKIARETWLAPTVVVFSGLTAGAAIVGATVAFIRAFGTP